MAVQTFVVESTDPVLPAAVSGAMEANDAEAIAGTSATKWMTPRRVAVRDEKLDIRSRGAVVGGNATTNAAAINQSVTDAALSGGKGIVLIPGQFSIDDAVDMLGADGVHLHGTSILASKLTQTSLAQPIIKISGAYQGLHNLQLAYSSQSSTDGADAIQMDALVRYGHFEDLFLFNCHTGITLDGVTTPRGEFSNLWENIRIGPFSAQAIRLVPTSTGGTGSCWNNIYINNFTGSVAGACTDYPVQLTNHGGVFNQLNIEWCNTVTAARDLMLLQQCHGLVVNRLHMEGNVLPASRGFISTFTTNECTVQINGLHLFDNDAATGNIGIVRPGAGTHIYLANVIVDQNTGIAATWYTIFDTSIATGAVVIIDELLDPDSHIDGYSLNYAGSAHARGYKGADVGWFGVTPVGRRTLGAAATDAATTQTLANNLRQALIDLGLGQT